MFSLVQKYLKNQKLTLPAAFIAGLALMYYILPKKPAEVITKTEIIEKEKIVIQWKKESSQKTDENRDIETTIITKPDGSTETTIKDKTKVITDSKSSESGDKTSSSEKSTKEEKIVTNQKDWIISAYTYSNPSDLINNPTATELKYQAGLSYRLFGPFFVGGFITSEKEVGLGVNIEF